MYRIFLSTKLSLHPLHEEEHYNCKFTVVLRSTIIRIVNCYCKFTVSFDSMGF